MSPMNALRSWIAAIVSAVGRTITALLRRTRLISASAQTPLPPAQGGRWDPVFELPNVAIHASLLPDGKVLFWGRREEPGGSMNEHFCTPHVWDPATGSTTPTPQPQRADGTTVNLFCAGHAYLPDGRLLVAGGHLADGDGIDYAGTYDHCDEHLDTAARHERRPLVPDRDHARRRPGAGDLGQRGGARHDRGERGLPDQRRRGRQPVAARPSTSSGSRSTRACTSPPTAGSSWRAPTP